MNNFMNKLPKIALYTLMAVSLVFTAMFWLGGSSTVEINGETLSEPAYTDPYLVWTYVLFGIALVLIVVISIVKFVTNFIANPKKGVVTLLVLALFAAVFIISWFAGSDAKIDIVGYDGTDNVGTMARYSDMCIYAAYTLFAATILALVGSTIYAKFK